MKRLFRFISLLSLVLSCSVQEKESSFKNKFLDGSEVLDANALDSLYIAMGKSDDITDYKVIDMVLQHTKGLKDSLVLAKSYNLVARMYEVTRDYEKAIEFLLKAGEIFENKKLWVDVMTNSKDIAIIHRNRGKKHLIEKLLKSDIRRISEADNNSFGILYPIHELAVHYSYDLEEHELAVEYGELFFDKLAHFDSLQIENKRFDYMVAFEKDVIDLILGVSYGKIGKLDKSYEHLQKSLTNYGKRKDAEKLGRVHKAFIEYYLNTGEREKLIHHKDEFYKSTLEYVSTFSKSQKEINQLKIKSVEDEKALQLLKEENKNKSLLIYFTIGALFAFTIFQWYSSKLRREKREVALKLEKQYEFDEFKTNLLITVAHELRTPLTIILGHLQLISDEKVKPENFKVYFNKIKNSSQGILNKMSDIIHLLKEDKTKNPVILKEVGVQPYLKNLFFAFEGMATIKKIQLVFLSRLPANHVIKTDPDILGRLLNNLIVNAIKFSPSNSKIVLDASYDGKYLTLKVIDHGIGISKENIGIIFKKFNRVPTISNVDGFGLGLAIVKESVDRLNGKVTVESNLGKGSTFTLSLPNETPIVTRIEKSTIAVPKEEIMPDAVVQPRALDMNKVLIVEDNPEMCSFYDSIFSSVFDCVFAFNGLEGIEILEKKPIDIIISDVMMPKMDGFEFKEHIRSKPNLQHIPFIMVTARDHDESKIRALNIGVDDYIVKPFNKNELIARMKSLIANKREREQWSLANADETDNFDVKTVRKLHEIVLKNCNDENFNVLNLANEIGLSQRQLVRVTKKLTGLTPVQFILEARLLEAYKKIKNKDEADINGVRFAVGIQSASYFSTQFKKRFGIKPKELLKKRKGEIIQIE